MARYGTDASSELFIIKLKFGIKVIKMLIPKTTMAPYIVVIFWTVLFMAKLLKCLLSKGWHVCFEPLNGLMHDTEMHLFVWSGCIHVIYFIAMCTSTLFNALTTTPWGRYVTISFPLLQFVNLHSVLIIFCMQNAYINAVSSKAMESSTSSDECSDTTLWNDTTTKKDNEMVTFSASVLYSLQRWMDNCGWSSMFLLWLVSNDSTYTITA